jgi:hypothetical protein
MTLNLTEDNPMTYQPIQKRNGNGRLRPTPKVSLGTPTAKLTSRKLGPTAQQELTQRTQELAQGEKILRHYIAHAQRTGQYNYPALVAHVLTAHTVATAPVGTRLLAKTIFRLVSQVEQAVATITTATEGLTHGIAALGEGLSTDSMGINQAQVCGEIKIKSQTVSKAIDALVVMGRQHGAPQTTEEGKLVEFLSSELHYFRQYFLEYAQPDRIMDDFKAGDPWDLYSRRLFKYLGLLPGYALLLGNSITATIEAKALPDPSEPSL